MSDYSVSLQMHYEQEHEIIHQLLLLEDLFRNHYQLLKKESQFQKDLVDRLWILSQRYSMLVSTDQCCNFPDIYVAPTEDVIMQEYAEKLQQLRASDCRLCDSINTLYAPWRRFEQIYSQLDMTVDTPLIMGDAFHKPIKFFHELVYDLFTYLHALALKYNYLAYQVDPLDPISLEDLKAALELSEDFEEYLLVGLTYCKCLRPPQPC